MTGRGRRILGAASAAVVGIGSAAVSASAADTGTNALEAGASAYRAAYPQLSPSQARAAAAGSDARRAVYDAAGADAKTYGGAWFDPLTGIVHVAATTDAAVKNIAAIGRRYGVAVQAHRVARSVAALEQAAAKLRAGKDEVGQAAKGRVGFDVKTNQVTAAVPASRRTGLQRAAAAGDVKLVEAPAATPEPDYGCTTRYVCDWTLRAGVNFQLPNGTQWCAIGFTARTTANVRYAYSAGHCSQGVGQNWTVATTTSVGPVESVQDTGPVDALIVKVTNTWFTSDTGGEIYYVLDNHTVPVKGVAPYLGYIVAGETVCLSANYADPAGTNLCGVVGTNSDASFRGMVRVDGVDACGGDSGGGWYWLPASGNRYAYGIHSSSDGGCHGDAGGTRSWFSAMPTVKANFTPNLNVELR